MPRPLSPLAPAVPAAPGVRLYAVSGVVQTRPFLGNTDERNRPADDGGEFTREDVKSMQGAVRRA